MQPQIEGARWRIERKARRGAVHRQRGEHLARRDAAFDHVTGRCDARWRVPRQRHAIAGHRRAQVRRWRRRIVGRWRRHDPQRAAVECRREGYGGRDGVRRGVDGEHIPVGGHVCPRAVCQKGGDKAAG